MKIQHFFCVLAVITLGLAASAQVPADTQSGDKAELPGALTGQKDDASGFVLPQKEQMPAALDEEKSKQISRYFDEALKNYEEILGSREEREIKTVEKRIDSNKELLDKSTTKLSETENILRRMKGQYLRRYLALKSSHEQGNIDKATYENQLDKLAQEYVHQLENLEDDASYYRDEKEKTRARLETLQEINRINGIIQAQQQRDDELDIEQAGGPQGSRQEPERIPTQLELLMFRIEAAGCFQDQDVWRSPHIN